MDLLEPNEIGHFLMTKEFTFYEIDLPWFFLRNGLLGKPQWTREIYTEDTPSRKNFLLFNDCVSIPNCFFQMFVAIFSLYVW